jgi:hypothetical protein
MWWKYSVQMYVNEKRRHVETIPGMGGGELKKKDGESEFNYEKW